MSASLSSSSSGFAGEAVRRPSEDYLHVLAVDDNSVDRMLIEKLLKRLSCRVTTVESGKRALEVLENQKNLPVAVNVIFTDYCMPEVTGYDLLKRVKESSALRGIPVVLMSSENNPTRISRCLEGGAEEFLLKPVSQLDVRRLHDRFMRTN